MKRFLIAIFAIALLTAGAPLFAQSQDEPTTSELQSEQMENAPAPGNEVETETASGAEIETETELDGDTEVETDEYELEADLDDESYDDDELPATGSELPLAALLGLASLAGAAALRVRS